MVNTPTGNPNGRPSAYDDSYAAQAEKLCKLGATDPEIADFFGVSTQTITSWKKRYPEFLAALKSGKDEADDRVERSLYQRAIGYQLKVEKVFFVAGKQATAHASETEDRIVRTEAIEHIQPDTTACIFWLKNRRRTLWRDKHEIDVTAKDSTEASALTNAELDNRVAEALKRVEELTGGAIGTTEGKKQSSDVRKLN